MYVTPNANQSWPLTRFKDKISAIVDMFRYDYNYHSWSRKKIEVPFAWLTTGAIFLVMIALFTPADLEYGRVSPYRTAFLTTLNDSVALGAGHPFGDIDLVRSTGGVVALQGRPPMGVRYSESNRGVGATIH